MATPFERFRAKYYLAWDAMRRIGPPDAITEETAGRDQAYLEGQLGRIEVNAKRAANYLSECQFPGTIDTDLETDRVNESLSDLVDELTADLDDDDELKRKGIDGTNGKHDGEVKP